MWYFQHSSFLGRFYFHWVVVWNSEMHIGLASRHVDSCLLLPCFFSVSFWATYHFGSLPVKERERILFFSALQQLQWCLIWVLEGYIEIFKPFLDGLGEERFLPWADFNSFLTTLHSFTNSSPAFLTGLCIEMPFRKRKKESVKNYCTRQPTREAVNISMTKKWLKPEINRKLSN